MGSLVERLGECGHLLQVALDFTDLRDAIRVGSLTSLGPAVILEAGTPLIKSEGMKSVDILRSLPGRHLVMADTKTADVGGLEARLAFEHGADAMSVLAASSEETIKEAVREAEATGRDVYADLIGFTDLDSWLRKAKGAGRPRGCDTHRDRRSEGPRYNCGAGRRHCEEGQGGLRRTRGSRRRNKAIRRQRLSGCRRGHNNYRLSDNQVA